MELDLLKVRPKVWEEGKELGKLFVAVRQRVRGTGRVAVVFFGKSEKEEAELGKSASYMETFLAFF